CDSIVPFIHARCGDQRAYYFALEESENHGRHVDDDAALSATPADVLIALKLVTAADDAIRAATSDLPRRPLKLDRLVLTHCELTGLHLEGAEMDGAILQNVTFHSCA